MFKIPSNITFCVSFRNILDKRCLNCLHWNSLKKISTKPKNHYEILKVSRNCSSKEIREAFITLSKQYHPDKNEGNLKAQEEFVKINEAYNILIKPDSRRDYDISLKSFSESNRVYKSKNKDGFYEVHRYDSYYRDPWKESPFTRNRNFSEEDANNYYGIKGVKRRSNRDVLFWIVLFAGFCLFIQLAIIKFSTPKEGGYRDVNKRYMEYIQARKDYYGTHQRQVEALRRRLERMRYEDEFESDLPEEDNPK